MTQVNRYRAGVNLPGLFNYEPCIPFVALHRQTGGWTAANPGTTNPWEGDFELQLDEDGWPILGEDEAARTSVLAGWGNTKPAGHYTVKWAGTGTVTTDWHEDDIISSTSNSFVVDMPAGDTNNFTVRIDSSDDADPVRDVEIYAPGYDGSAGEPTFHPDFLSMMGEFKLVRMMNWQRTNGSELVSWSERPTTSDWRWSTDGGVPIEIQVELCNELGADGWFNIPHEADDNFITEMMTYIRDNLDEGLLAYIEWSNEIWNINFPQNGWTDDLANSRGDDFVETWAERIGNAFTIANSVFSGETDRIVRVVAGQAGNPTHVSSLTNHLSGNYDAVSCAAYIGVDESSYDGTTTPQNIFDDLYDDLDAQRPLWQDHKDTADQRSGELGRTIPLIAYEGGQHVVPGSSSVAWYGAYEFAQADERMYDLYRAIMEVWFVTTKGRDLAFYRSHGFITENGAWGLHAEWDQDTADAHKYRAVTTSDYSGDGLAVEEESGGDEGGGEDGGGGSGGASIRRAAMRNRVNPGGLRRTFDMLGRFARAVTESLPDPFEDDFNRADENLDEHERWGYVDTGGGRHVVAGNLCDYTSAAQAPLIGDYSADQFAECELTNITGGNIRGTVGVRIQSETRGGYYLTVRSGDCSVRRVDESGSEVAVINEANLGFTATVGMIARIEAEGTTFRVYVDGQLIDTGSNSYWSDGNPGALTGNGNEFDNFKGGSL